MPELPEVETMASDLNRSISGKIIKSVWFDFPKQISIIVSGGFTYKGKITDRLNLGESQKYRDDFNKIFLGLKVKKVQRRAKNVLVCLSDNKMLLVHPKMTGHLLLGKWAFAKNKPTPIGPELIKQRVNSYIHFLVAFGDGSMLGFSDARKFGKILLGDEDVILKSKDLKDLGPEPLSPEFTLERFMRIAKGASGPAKKFLLNQNKIAGIGNIYSDDILWMAKVHPLRQIKSLRAPELKAIFAAIKKILAKAVKFRGTSMSDFRDPSGETGLYMKHILVYGKKGEKCLRCGSLIKRVVVGGRSAHFCPRCQK